MAYIAGIVERGEGTPIAGGETIPAAVLRYVRSLEALREENARLTRERDEAREDAKTLREGWDREEKLRRDRDAAYQKRVEELEQTTRKFGVVQEELFRRAEAAEAKLATMVAWCRHAPDQWVMRKDVLYVLAAAKGE